MKYFLHDTNSFQDEKITELYIEFGYEGLGLFYTVLEKLAMQEKPIKTKVLKSQLKVGKRLEKCWSFMEEIELFSTKNGETFNEKLLLYSEKYQVKKQKNKERISQWRENQEVTKNVIHYENVRNTPKLKKSKEKKSKGTLVAKATTTTFSLCKDLFLKHYLTNETTAYYFTPKCAGNLKQLIKKIEFKMTESGQQNEPEKVASGFKIFIEAINDKWILNNLSIPNINSKFNEIYGKLKTNKNEILSVEDYANQTISTLINEGTINETK